MAKNSGQSEILELKIARNQADEYDEIVVRQSGEACDCRDCEAAIKFGIHLFDWLIDADQRYRSELYEGKLAYDKETEQAIEYLLRRWHQRCDDLVNWANRHVARGFDVVHLAEFQRRCEESTAIIAALDETKADQTMSEPLLLLRDKALEDHRNGQTADFF